MVENKIGMNEVKKGQVRLDMEPEGLVTTVNHNNVRDASKELEMSR